MGNRVNLGALVGGAKLPGPRQQGAPESGSNQWDEPCRRWGEGGGIVRCLDQWALILARVTGVPRRGFSMDQ